MAWKSTAQFLDGQSQSLLIGKVTKADSTDEPWTAQTPQICCPICKQLVSGLADTQEVSPPPKHKGLNEQPVGSVNPNGTAVRWLMYPCGCEVGVVFAGLYTSEVNHRKQGGTPRPVSDGFLVGQPAKPAVATVKCEDFGYAHLAKVVNPSEVGKPKPPPQTELQTKPAGPPPKPKPVVCHQGAYELSAIAPHGAQVGDKMQIGNAVGVISWVQQRLPDGLLVRVAMASPVPLPPQLEPGVNAPVLTVNPLPPSFLDMLGKRQRRKISEAPTE